MPEFLLDKDLNFIDQNKIKIDSEKFYKIKLTVNNSKTKIKEKYIIEILDEKNKMTDILFNNWSCKIYTDSYYGRVDTKILIHDNNGDSKSKEFSYGALSEVNYLLNWGGKISYLINIYKEHLCFYSFESRNLFYKNYIKIKAEKFNDFGIY